MNILFFLSSWVPVGVWAGLIYFLSSIPHLHSGFKWDFFLRKGAHVFEYTVLTTLLFRALRRTWGLWTWARCAAVAATLAVVYASSDEYHQSFVPGRGPSVRDVLIDTVGVVIAILFLKRTKMYE